VKRKIGKLELHREELRRVEPAAVNGGITTYTTTADEACSGPCCGKVTVSWCAGKDGA
jgi:hypothetical protein